MKKEREQGTGNREPEKMKNGNREPEIGNRGKKNGYRVKN